MRPTSERVLPWLLRLAWVAVAVAGAAAIDGATADRGAAVADVARYGGAVVWIAGVIAMALLAVVSLTATRVIVPLALPAAGMTLTFGADLVDGMAFAVTALVAALLAASGDTGRAFVQASAYGDERRYPLRPPAAYLLASVITWALWAAVLLACPLLLAARQWILGGPLSVLAAAGLMWGWRRWHRLSRRWLVVVPAGLVIHDHLVLAETLMLRRVEIAEVRLAPAGTGALDLTGPAAGHALEIVANEPATAIMAATPRTPRGTPVHFTACLIAPSRPGRALAAAIS